MNNVLKHIVLICVTVLLIVACAFFLNARVNAPTIEIDSPEVEQEVPEEPLEEPLEEPVEPLVLSRFLPYLEQNEDTVGWIYVPNSQVDYPVVYGSDNAFYLSHNYLKRPDKAGTPFLDMSADDPGRNRSLSLYGHYMSDGSMFSALHRYKDLDYYKSFPRFYYDTLYERGVYKIFSVFYMAGNRTDRNFYYYPMAYFSDDAAFMDHVEQLRKRSIFNTTVDVTASDLLVLMTTCTYEVDNLRLIIAGRKVRPGESISVDVENAVKNPAPLYPQKMF